MSRYLFYSIYGFWPHNSLYFAVMLIISKIYTDPFFVIMLFIDLRREHSTKTSPFQKQPILGLIYKKNPLR